MSELICWFVRMRATLIGGISVTISCGGFTEFLCRQILLDCKSANCPYALVSDGGTCVLVKYKNLLTPTQHLLIKVDKDTPPRLILASMLCMSARAFCLLCNFGPSLQVSYPVQGALNKDYSLINSEDILRGFAEFDIYSKQRSQRRFRHFISWYHGLDRNRALQAGDTLLVDVGGFMALNHRLRPMSYFPTIPKDTV